LFSLHVHVIDYIWRERERERKREREREEERGAEERIGLESAKKKMGKTFQGFTK